MSLTQQLSGDEFPEAAQDARNFAAFNADFDDNETSSTTTGHNQVSEEEDLFTKHPWKEHHDNQCPG